MEKQHQYRMSKLKQSNVDMTRKLDQVVASNSAMQKMLFELLESRGQEVGNGMWRKEILCTSNDGCRA